MIGNANCGPPILTGPIGRRGHSGLDQGHRFSVLDDHAPDRPKDSAAVTRSFLLWALSAVAKLPDCSLPPLPALLLEIGLIWALRARKATLSDGLLLVMKKRRVVDQV